MCNLTPSTITIEMSTLAISKCLVVFVYVWQMMATFYRTVYWFVLSRTSRISHLAYQLEQLNGREQDLCRELALLNAEYLTRSTEIQARRTSVAMDRAKILDELAQTTTNSSVKSLPVSTIKAIKGDKSIPKNVTKPKASIDLKTSNKPKSTPEEKPKLVLGRSTSLVVPETVPTRMRTPSPLLLSRSLIFERPKTPEITVRPPVRVPQTRAEPVVMKEAPIGEKSVKRKVADQQASPSSFTALSGFNMATHRVNEYIDLIVDSAINEFRRCDNDLSGGNKRCQRFRAAIKELYGDPEWRPFINDLKKQYQIFYYL